MLVVVIYLQKASLKAVGLISRDKAVVVAGEDHLRREKGRGGMAKREKELKDKEGKWESAKEKNRTEIRNAEIADTVQASVHKEANSCSGGKHRWHTNSPLEVEVRGESWKKDECPFFHLGGMQKRSTRSEVRVKEEFALARWGGWGGGGVRQTLSVRI